MRIDVETGRRRRVLLFWLLLAKMVLTAIVWGAWELVMGCR